MSKDKYNNDNFVIIDGKKLSRIALEEGYRFHGTDFIKHVKETLKENERSKTYIRT